MRFKCRELQEKSFNQRTLVCHVLPSTLKVLPAAHKLVLMHPLRENQTKNFLKLTEIISSFSLFW